MSAKIKKKFEDEFVEWIEQYYPIEEFEKLPNFFKTLLKKSFIDIHHPDAIKFNLAGEMWWGAIKHNDIIHCQSPKIEDVIEQSVDRFYKLYNEIQD